MATRSGFVYYIDYARLELIARRQTRKLMDITVREIQITARRNVLFRKHPGVPPRPIGLANSIYGTVRTTSYGYSGQVGSNLSYAASVEEGASRHVIRARPGALGGGVYFGRRNLVFFWVREGKWFVGPKVNHPGQKGKHYLRNALLRVAKRRGFRVIIT